MLKFQREIIEKFFLKNSVTRGLIQYFNGMF